MVKTLATLPEDLGLSLSTHMTDSSHPSINFSLRRSDTFLLVLLAPSLHTGRQSHRHITLKEERERKKRGKWMALSVETTQWIKTLATKPNI